MTPTSFTSNLRTLSQAGPATPTHRIRRIAEAVAAHPALRSRVGGAPTPAWVVDQVAQLPPSLSEADVITHLVAKRVAIVEALERRLANPPGPPSSPAPGELGPRRSASQQLLGARPPGRSATSSSGVRHELAARTGFTTPSATYDKMRRMHVTSALPLYRDVANVGDPVYRESYESWFERGWSPFYEKYAGPRSSELARLGAFFTSDEVAARAERFRQELEHFYADYPRQRTSAGQPIPAPSGVTPSVTLTAMAPGSVPWWTWAIGAALVGALGWTVYQHARVARRPRPSRQRANTRSREDR